VRSVHREQREQRDRLVQLERQGLPVQPDRRVRKECRGKQAQPDLRGQLERKGLKGRRALKGHKVLRARMEPLSSIALLPLP
jgi:hypothetical protein